MEAIEQLTLENEALRADNKELSDSVAAKSSMLLVVQDENENLIKHISKLVADSAIEIETLRSENEVLVAVNDELTAKIEELSKAPAQVASASTEIKALTLPKDTFEVDGVKYQFVSPVFMRQKQRVTAQEALKDSKLLEELVKAGSGSIKKA